MLGNHTLIIATFAINADLQNNVFCLCSRYSFSHMSNKNRDAKMKKNNTNKPIRTAIRFSISMVVIATVAIFTIGSTIAYAETGFDNGYAKGKFDITHGQPLNDTCLPKGLACDQFKSGYVTAWNQYAYHPILLAVNITT